MRSAEVTGTSENMTSEFSRMPPLLYATDGVAVVESSLACVMSTLVCPPAAVMVAGVSLKLPSSPMVAVAVASATGLPEESRGATLVIPSVSSPIFTSQSVVLMSPESGPPSKVTTVSVRLRVSAAKGSPYVACTCHTALAGSEVEPTSRPPSGVAYDITGGGPSSRPACVIATVLPAFSASVDAAAPPWAEMPVTSLGVDVMPSLVGTCCVTAQACAASVAVTSPLNVTSVVSPSRDTAVKSGVYVALVEPPANARPASLLIPVGVTVYSTPGTALTARWSVAVRVGRSYVTSSRPPSGITSGSRSKSAGKFVSSGAVTAKLAAVSGGVVSRASSNLMAIIFVPVNSVDSRIGAVLSSAMRSLLSSPITVEEAGSTALPARSTTVVAAR